MKISHFQHFNIFLQRRYLLLIKLAFVANFLFINKKKLEVNQISEIWSSWPIVSSLHPIRSNSLCVILCHSCQTLCNSFLSISKRFFSVCSFSLFGSHSHPLIWSELHQLTYLYCTFGSFPIAHSFIQIRFWSGKLLWLFFFHSYFEFSPSTACQFCWMCVLLSLFYQSPWFTFTSFARLTLHHHLQLRPPT